MSLGNIRAFAVSALVVCVLSWGAALISADGPRSECVEIYRPQPTDSCESIYEWSGITPAEIEALNPDLTTCDAPLNVDEVCLDSFTPACTHDVPATTTTCDNLASEWNITVAQFVQLNDNVDDACDDLVVGQQYCVSDIDCFPGNTNPWCTSF